MYSNLIYEDEKQGSASEEQADLVNEHFKQIIQKQIKELENNNENASSYDFESISLEMRLAIICTIISSPIFKTSIEKFSPSESSEQLRSVPLGRDKAGNSYFIFKNNEYSFVLKDFYIRNDPNSKPYCKILKSKRDFLNLIQHINTVQYDASIVKSELCKENEMDSDDSYVECIECKNMYHAKCIQDLTVHEDAVGWKCNLCNQEQLLEAVRTLCRKFSCTK